MTEPACIYCREPIEGYTASFNDTPVGPMHFLCSLAARMNEKPATAPRDELADVMAHLRRKAQRHIETANLSKGSTRSRHLHVADVLLNTVEELHLGHHRKGAGDLHSHSARCER